MGQVHCFLRPAKVLNEVDNMLQKEYQKDQLNPKILLLGAGESGKSTVVKQIKYIWKAGNSGNNSSFSEVDNKEFIFALRRNSIEVMQTMLEAASGIGLPWPEDLDAEAKSICSASAFDNSLSPPFAASIKRLWLHPFVQEVYSRRSEYWLLDATPYYMSEIERFAEDDFQPTEEDCLMARVRTTGIVSTEVPYPPFTYHVVDVGGQRSERRKWINCFDNVSAIIFLEGLSGYNQVLFEDSRVNRMHESLQLFESILKNPLFVEIPIFIFLNKKDLFEQMITQYPLQKCFPDYTGPVGEMQPALDFIIAQYQSIAKRVCPTKSISIHVIAARVRMDIKVAFGDVKEALNAKLREKKK